MNVAMLGRDNLTPRKRAELKADVEAELRELTIVTNELIALAADNARTEVPTPVDITSVARSACLRWERRSARLVRFERSDATSDIVFVSIGPTALQRVVDNLISSRRHGSGHKCRRRRCPVRRPIADLLTGVERGLGELSETRGAPPRVEPKDTWCTRTARSVPTGRQL